MKNILNKNGFTLIELLVVMVILGIITGFSIPLIRNIEKSNQVNKFNTFKESLINGAKLYIDSYGEDDISKDDTCVNITFNAMESKKLVKKFPDTSLNCDTEDTYVRVIIGNGKYKYEVNIKCVSPNDTSAVVYKDFIELEGNNSSSCEKIN